MGRYTRNQQYDFCPDECDDIVMPKIVKAASIRKTKKGVTPRLLLEQEHLTHDGKLLVSHLLAMPAGQDVPVAIRHLFNQHPYDPKKARISWNIISDEELAMALPDHDIYWLCSPDWLPTELVKTVVQAALGEKQQPTRKITNEYEVVLG